MSVLSSWLFSFLSLKYAFDAVGMVGGLGGAGSGGVRRLPCMLHRGSPRRIPLFIRAFACIGKIFQLQWWFHDGCIMISWVFFKWFEVDLLIFMSFPWPRRSPNRLVVLESCRQLAAELKDPVRLHSIARCSKWPLIIPKMVGLRLQQTSTKRKTVLLMHWWHILRKTL